MSLLLALPGSLWLFCFRVFKRPPPGFSAWDYPSASLLFFLRNAKARFSLLVITLAVMLGRVWAGILLAFWHPLFSL